MRARAYKFLFLLIGINGLYYILWILFTVGKKSSRQSVSCTRQEKVRKFPIFPHALDLEDARGLVDDLREGKPSLIQPINRRYTSINISEASMSCAPEHSSTFSILVLIKTRRSEVEFRSSLRDSLGNQFASSKSGAFFQYGFLIGQSDEDIEEEIAEHRDFIIGDFEDTYRNLTYKSMMGIHWAAESCPGFDFYVGLDVDTHLFLENFLKFLKDPYNYPQVNPALRFGEVLGSHEHFYSGGVVYDTYPIREPDSNYYVSWEDHPGVMYPPYLSGMTVIMSKETVTSFYYVSPYVHHISVDDAYLGILANKLRITPYQVGDLTFNGYSADVYPPEYYQQGYFKQVLSVLNFSVVQEHLQ